MRLLIGGSPSKLFHLEDFANNLKKYGVEIGGGLGSLAGNVWRIGLMGYNSTSSNVDMIINLFELELPNFK